MKKKINFATLFNSKMNSETAPYSEQELNELEELLHQKIEEVKQNKQFLMEQLLGNAHGTEDTGHSLNIMEDGQLSDMRENLAMLIARENKFLLSLQQALERIKNKTYGFCRMTGKTIPVERLRLVPHTTLSIEGKELLDKQKNDTKK